MRHQRWHGRPRVQRAALTFFLLGLMACSTASPQNSQDAGSPLPPDAGPGVYRQGSPAPQKLTEVAAAVVGDRIYLLGGLAMGGITHRVEIYDPRQNTWSAGPSLPATAPTHHLAVAVYNDQVYVLGGYLDLAFTPSAATWRLDPLRGDWTRLRDQPVTRGAATAQRLGNLLYVAGGVSGGQATAALWAYDAQLDAWQSRSPMPTPREHLASCSEGLRMLVVAGRTSRAGNLATAEIYDAASDGWTAVANLPTARGGLAAAPLAGRCYVLGGEALAAPPPNTYGEVEGFDFAMATWTRHTALPTPRHGLAVVAWDGAIYTLLGGPIAGFHFSDTVEIFTP